MCSLFTIGEIALLFAYGRGNPALREEYMDRDICLICSQDKLENGLIVCNDCNYPKQMTIVERLMRTIEILKTPEDSDEIWFCIGELEEIAKTLNTERIEK
jgi:hypothetical protein